MTKSNGRDPSECFSREFLDAVQVVYLDETTSTSDVARERAGAAGFVPTLVMADYQSRGRGQYVRKWYSKPAKDVLATLAVPLDFLSQFRGSTDPFKVTTRLPLAVSAAVGGALEAHVGCRVSLKWPNDLLIDGKKFAGILMEVPPSALLIGVGVNVNSRVVDYPPQLRGSVTTLLEETGREWDRMEIAGVAVNAVFDFLSRYSIRAEDDLMNYFLSRDSSANKQMEVTVSGRKQVVTVRGINFADGSLDCLTASGERTLIYSLGTWMHGK